jgi:hypothetical protein
VIALACLERRAQSQRTGVAERTDQARSSGHAGLVCFGRLVMRCILAVRVFQKKRGA